MISKKKEMLLGLAIIILLILPTSFASEAIDTNQSDSLSSNDELAEQTLEINDIDSPLKANQVYVDSENGNPNGSGTEDDPVKTISDGLNRVGNGGTIYLSGNFSGDGNSNLTLYDTPEIIEFVGLGKAVIDGNYSTSFATVNDGVYKFHNISFINNYKSGDEEIFGGAIYNIEGILTFDNCLFENNGVNGINRANGGAVDSSGTLVFRNCKFVNNTAYVTNSSGFRKNAADGGALSNLGKLYIYDTIFIDNRAMRNGGAIRTQDGAVTVIENSEFEGNSASYHLSGGSFGGAIYTWDCGLNVTNSIFKNNRVYDASGYGAQGGAISSDRGSGVINIKGCQFINNTADGTMTVNGQSIYIGSVTANINYCTIDTSVYSVSQSSDFNCNWWVANNTDFNKLIENLPANAKVKTFAEAKISSNVEELEPGKTIPLTVGLYWNGTENQEDIGLIPVRMVYLSVNCGELADSQGYLTNGSFSTTLNLTNTDNPLITANIDDVIVKFDFAKDNKTRIKVNCADIREGQVAFIVISSNNPIDGICLIDVGDGKYYAELVNGTANATISNLKAGKYNVTVKCVNNETLTASAAFNVTDPITTNIVVSPSFSFLTTDYGAGERGGYLKFTLKDSDGNVLANKTVQIALSGKIFTAVTNKDGIGALRINLASSNVYTCALSFNGDENSTAAPLAITKLTVIKKKTAINALSRTFKANVKTKTITVTLKTVKNLYDGKTYLKKGKKLTLTIKGKTYVAKTNAKGVAKFTIKLTKKGKYTAKIRFAGDATYKASARSIRITIK